MSATKMHEDEVETSTSLVVRLLAQQFPQWAELPVERVPSAGTDNTLYRLGEKMVVRLPRIGWAVTQVHNEQEWLPQLAPQLPLEIPVPLALGEPAEEYPWHWSIYRWLDGENATAEHIDSPRQAAAELARFVHALQHIDTAGGIPAGPPNSSRGVPLALRDADTRAAIAKLDGTIDTDAATAVWETALQAPVWSGPPVWVHGDLQSGNLLAHDGRLSAVIDFGCLGVGDPATDVMAAWLYLSADTRDIFREILQVDDASWTRGRGWALSMGLIALPYYMHTNPVLAGIGRRAIGETLDDYQENG